MLAMYQQPFLYFYLSRYILGPAACKTNKSLDRIRRAAFPNSKTFFFFFLNIFHNLGGIRFRSLYTWLRV